MPKSMNLNSPKTLCLKWTYWHFGNGYRVASLLKMIAQEWKVKNLEDNSNMPNITNYSLRTEEINYI